LNKGIDIQRFSSPANVYNAFITGAVDISYGTLDLDQVADLESQASSKGWQVISERSNGIYVLTMNLKDKELSQLKVREAIASLINRDLIKNRVFRGQIEPLYSSNPCHLTRILSARLSRKIWRWRYY
jgi:peptide/nickel transport system substrate-binding protein